MPSFDAMEWARAFCKTMDEHGVKDANGNRLGEDWMVSWFAAALMRGFDERAARQ